VEQHLLPLSAAALGALALTVGCAARKVGGPASMPPAGVATAEPAATPASEAAQQQNATEAAPAAGSREQSTEPPKTDSAVSSAAQATSSATIDALPQGTLVLHVGDSFAGSLGVPLGHRFKARGVRSVLEFLTSSYVPTWASSTDLLRYVARYNPDLVIVTLGANEFELSAPDTRAGAVRRLVKHLGNRPCVWVTPPRWKQDTGILAVIRANVKPCRFLDSDTVVHDLARKQDKIHPSDPGREVWADAVLAWLARERQGTSERPWQLKEEAP